MYVLDSIYLHKMPQLCQLNDLVLILFAYQSARIRTSGSKQNQILKEQ